MKINWKVRLKNPVFWAQVAVALLSPILVSLGLQWEDMTTWSAFGRGAAPGGVQPRDFGGGDRFPVGGHH